MAHNMAFSELEHQVNEAILNKHDFGYETNFNSTALFWPRRFKENGYQLNLIYLSLHSVEEAQRRVSIRVQNGGHYVPDDEIMKRYYEGFANLNTHFRYFDIVVLLDTSKYAQSPEYLLSVENGTIITKRKLDNYLFHLIPDIANNV